MKKKTSEKVSDTKEQKFQDLMDHGDDFFKIELLRPAKKCYKQALELNIDPEKVKQKIAECDRLLTFEKRVVWILLSIVAVAIIFWIISRNLDLG